MMDVSLIGLGAMGSALARAFLGAGHSLCVWNRTAAKSEPLATRGAMVAGSPVDAAKSSSAIVFCVDNYDVSRRIIGFPGVRDALSGRTLIQLSTGTPAEARDFSAWLNGQGVQVLNGAIMPYPDGIGAADAQILFAGPAALYGQHRPVLDCLGGDLRHVGEEMGAAAVLDMALLTHQLTNYLGVWHGARACEAEGVGVDVFASMLPQHDPAAHMAWRIHRQDYDKPGATLDVWNAALARVVTHAGQARINDEIPTLISSLFRRAIALGHGSRDLATVIEVLRSPAA